MVARPFVVGCIGTSLQSYMAGRHYQEEVRQRLALLSGRTVRFVNQAIPGAASGNVLSVQLPGMLRLRPNAVLIDSSMNDWQQLSRAVAAANVNAIVTSLKAIVPAASVFLMTMSPTVSPSGQATLDLFYDDYRSIATEQGVSLIDNYPDWLPLQAGEMPPDGHPTIQGLRRVLIPNVTEALLPLL